MGLILKLGPGQTPIDEDEKEGLLITTISTQVELNEVEQLNIEEAIQWTITKRLNEATVLSEGFVLELHQRMYGEVWRWAGQFRQTNKNIGVDKFHIATSLRNLLEDCRHWIQSQTFGPDEIAIRFKHRLVSIHCFPNGNGRHSRLMGDVIANKIFGQPVFSWGTSYLVNKSAHRETYLKALREADKDNISALIDFARR
ncbi:MAG: Fic family protein [Chitinophagaceae bacterium]|nr:Fic family protein [Chitinophagaceae bacterium]